MTRPMVSLVEISRCPIHVGGLIDQGGALRHNLILGTIDSETGADENGIINSTKPTNNIDPCVEFASSSIDFYITTLSWVVTMSQIILD